jgi:type III secretory pathway component EscT
MSNEQKDPQSKKTINPIIIQWLAIGIAIGTSLGIVFHNLPIGIGLGIMIGTSIGLTLSQTNKKD